MRKQIKCKECGRIVIKYSNNNKIPLFCKAKCYFKNIKGKRKLKYYIKKCELCGKKMEISENDNRKHCSVECRIGGFVGKKFVKNKYPNIGFRGFSVKRRQQGIKKGLKTLKINELGFYDPKVQSLGGKIAHAKHPNMSSENGKKAQKTLRIRKVGAFHDTKLRLKLSSRGGHNAQLLHPELYKEIGSRTAEILRKRKRIFWKGIYYASYEECEFAMNIYYQLEKLKEYKNYQFKLGSFKYDFFIKKYKCFIEYHPHISFYKEMPKEYYNNRRQNLNKNGYKNYNLIIIK